MKSLRYLLAITTALAVVILFLLWLDSDATPPLSVNNPVTQHQQNPSAATSPEWHQQEAEIGALQRREARLEAMQQLLRQAQHQPGNLAAVLRELRQHCLPTDNCDALIQEMLERYNDPAFASLVNQAISRMPLYESAMQETILSTSLPPRERYDIIHQLREQTLGPEATEALFGQEKAWAEYQFGYGELMASGVADLSASQRLDALNRLREQAFGDYAAALDAIEGVDGRYQRELEILLEGITDSDQQSQITRQLRETHYGAETTRQMEQQDARQQAQQQQVAAYQQELEQLNRELENLKDSLPETEWLRLHEQRLTELRLRHFSSGNE